MTKISKHDTDMLMSQIDTGDHFYSLKDGEYEERLVVGTFHPQGHCSSVSSVVVGGDQTDVLVTQFEEFYKLQAVNSLDGGPHVVRKPLPDGVVFIEKLDAQGEWSGPEPVGTVMMHDTKCSAIPDNWAPMNGVANADGSGVDASSW